MVQQQDTRVWLATGCSTGIGRAVAEELVSRGVSLVATARDPATLSDLVDRGGSRVATSRLDVHDPASVQAALDLTLDRFGRVDVLLNCAGTGLVGSIEESSDDEIDYVMQTNFYGTLRVIRTVLPHMRERGSGLIATMTSRGAFEGQPGTGIYCASKFAMNGMLESLAIEVKPLGIDVSILEPGLVKSNFRAAGITRAKRRMAEYDETCGTLRAAIEQEFPPYAYEASDVAVSLLAALSQPTTPLHLPLGGRAVDQIRAKLNSVLAGIAEWEDYARLRVPVESSLAHN
jgi:NAD(P)-dependent dehydrogenase (short-subunit alcohol dehydrogenase family)